MYRVVNNNNTITDIFRFHIYYISLHSVTCEWIHQPFKITLLLPLLTYNGEWFACLFQLADYITAGSTCTKHLKLRCSLSLTFNLVKIM